jgi:hypothetical protein
MHLAITSIHPAFFYVKKKTSPTQELSNGLEIARCVDRHDSRAGGGFCLGPAAGEGSIQQLVPRRPSSKGAFAFGSAP